MVKILANGDIVQDDDPRAKRMNASHANQAPNANQPTFSHHDQTQRNTSNEPNQDQQSGLDMINNKLLNFGIPRWSLGSVTVEPVYTIGALLMFFVFGFIPSLCLIAILYLFVQLSRNNNSLRDVFRNISRRFSGQGTARGATGRRSTRR